VSSAPTWREAFYVIRNTFYDAIRPNPKRTSFVFV